MCPYAECQYAECRYAECRYAECRGTDKRHREKIHGLARQQRNNAFRPMSLDSSLHSVTSFLSLTII